MGCRRTAARGFTMTELLLVAGIIGLLVALAIPGIQQTRRQDYESQAISKLAEIGLAEKRYFSQFRQFGKFEELQEAGLIPKGYTRQGHFAPVGSARSVRPYIELYSVRFTIPQTPNSLFFKIDAVPARQGLGLRTFNINLIMDRTGVADSLYQDPPVREGLEFYGPPVNLH
ncbi:MAG TPA: type II secretion system protein [bacterium]|nr:type II secretion system protein [bacterium]